MSESSEPRVQESDDNNTEMFERAWEETVTTSERRKQGFSSRPCPACGRQMLVRRRLPQPYRLLRRMGTKRNAYVCRGCGARPVLKREY